MVTVNRAVSTLKEVLHTPKELDLIQIAVQVTNNVNKQKQKHGLWRNVCEIMLQNWYNI